MSEENTQPEAAPASGLSLNDLAAAVQIIDICTKRGAFEGTELEVVGGVRGRLTAFLQANAPKKEEATEEEASAEEAANG